MDETWMRPDGSEVAKWPQGGAMIGGRVWAVTADVCGARKRGRVLPTPAARDARRGPGWGDQPGRPLSETVLRLLPTATAKLGDARRGSPSPEVGAQRIAGGRSNLDDAVAATLLPTSSMGNGRRSGGGQSSPPGLDEITTMMAGIRTANLPPDDELPPGTLATVRDFLPTPRASDGAKGGPNQRGSSGDLALSSAVQPGRWGAYALAIRRHERLLRRPAPEPTTPGRLGQPRLAPAFVEWMMCLPAGWVTDVLTERNPALTALGNGVNPVQIAVGLRRLGLVRAYERAVKERQRGLPGVPRDVGVRR